MKYGKNQTRARPSQSGKFADPVYPNGGVNWFGFPNVMPVQPEQPKKIAETVLGKEMYVGNNGARIIVYEENNQQVASIYMGFGQTVSTVFDCVRRSGFNPEKIELCKGTRFGGSQLFEAFCKKHKRYKNLDCVVITHADGRKSGFTVESGQPFDDVKAIIEEKFPSCIQIIMGSIRDDGTRIYTVQLE